MPPTQSIPKPSRRDLLVVAERFYPIGKNLFVLGIGQTVEAEGDAPDYYLYFVNPPGAPCEAPPFEMLFLLGAVHARSLALALKLEDPESFEPSSADG